MSGTAIEVKRLSGWKGDARLYRLTPPLAWTKWSDDETTHEAEYVIASAAVVPMSGPETYLFPADADGECTDWGELDGSYRGGLDHATALAGAGYEIDPETGR